MTYEEWYARATERFHAAPGLRLGQYLSNSLFDQRPHLFCLLKHSSLDPYFVDSRVPLFLEFVERNWDVDPVVAVSAQQASAAAAQEAMAMVLFLETDVAILERHLKALVEAIDGYVDGGMVDHPLDDGHLMATLAAARAVLARKGA